MSSFAGYPGLIGLDLLARDGLLKPRDLPDETFPGKRADFQRSIPLKRAALAIAFENLDVLLREETGLPVVLAEDPLTAVVMGAGKVLDELALLKDVTVQ